MTLEQLKKKHGCALPNAAYAEWRREQQAAKFIGVLNLIFIAVVAATMLYPQAATKAVVGTIIGIIAVVYAAYDIFIEGR